MRPWTIGLAVLAFVVICWLAVRIDVYGASLGVHHVPDLCWTFGMLFAFQLPLCGWSNLPKWPRTVITGFTIFMVPFMEAVIDHWFRHEASLPVYLWLSILDLAIGIFAYLMFAPAGRDYAAYYAKRKALKRVRRANSVH